MVFCDPHEFGAPGGASQTRAMRESLHATFRSLRVRNYRLYFFGQLVSLSGTWMQTVAQAWLVLKLSHNNAVAVGLITALQQLPTLLFGAWGGLIADRMDKRALLLAGNRTGSYAACGGGPVLYQTGAGRAPLAR